MTWGPRRVPRVKDTSEGCDYTGDRAGDRFAKIASGATINAMSSAFEAFQATLDLFETGVNLMRQNLRRAHPRAGEDEIDRLLRQWLVQRPGADNGDTVGRVVDLSTKRE
jgi:hypothetical protein